MDDLFTPASLITLAGCITAVVVVMNTIRHVCHWGPRWFALLLALIIAGVAYYLTFTIGTTSQTQNLHWLVRVIIIILNGCLIYTSAFGIQNQAVAKREQQSPAPPGPPDTAPGPTKTPAEGPIGFRTSW